MVESFTRFTLGEEPTQDVKSKTVKELDEEPSMEALFLIKQFAHSFFTIGKDAKGNSLSISLN